MPLNPATHSSPTIPDEVPHHEFLFGGLAYTVSVFTLYPFYKTIFFQQLDGIKWNLAFDRLRNEGIELAYRGVLPPLLQRAASGSVMFGVQSLTERQLIRHQRSSRDQAITRNKLISAVIAGVCEAPLMPFERVQTLLQNKHCFPSYRNTFHTLASLIRDHGVRELYRGLHPIIWRNCIANALYFTGHKWLSDLRVRGAHEGPLERGLWNFALGGLLGGFIGFATFPLNVTKTRLQSTVGGEFESFRSAIMALLYHRDDKPDVLRLYRGLPANFLRSIGSWGIITMTFHLLMECYSGIKS